MFNDKWLTKKIMLAQEILTPAGRIKLIINALVIIVIALVVYWLANKVMKLFSNTRSYADDINPQNLTYSESEYNTMADAIFQAADGWGTDEDTIYRVLSYLRTPDDWNKLVVVYGKDADGFYLPGRLVYELDHSEQEKVRQILKRIGVNF